MSTAIETIVFPVGTKARLAAGFVGTGKTLYPTEPITQDPSTGWYTAKFHKEGAPSGDSRFYRLTVGAERP